MKSQNVKTAILPLQEGHNNIWIFATTIKICTSGGFTQAYTQGLYQAVKLSTTL